MAEMQIERMDMEALTRRAGRPSFGLSSTSIPGLMLLIDVVSFAVAAVSAFVIAVTMNKLVLEYYVFSSGFITFISIYLMRNARMYEISAIMRPLARSDVTIVSIASAFLLFFAIALSLKSADIYSWKWIYWFLGLSIALTCTNRVLFKLLLTRLSSRGMIGRSLVVLGTGPQARGAAGPNGTQAARPGSAGAPGQASARIEA
jgi:FlaA1/EpsC-like NDP-sugar epimerase